MLHTCTALQLLLMLTLGQADCYTLAVNITPALFSDGFSRRTAAAS